MLSLLVAVVLVGIISTVIVWSAVERAKANTKAYINPGKAVGEVTITIQGSTEQVGEFKGTDQVTGDVIIGVGRA